MPSDVQTFESKQGMAWIQLGGPGNKYELMGACYNFGESNKPAGDETPVFCINPATGQSYIRKSIQGQPGMGAGNISAPEALGANYIPEVADMGCRVNIQVHKGCPPLDVYNNWQQMTHYDALRFSDPRISAQAAGTEASAENMWSTPLEFAGWNHVKTVTPAEVTGLATVNEPLALNGVLVEDKRAQCQSDCSDYTPGGRILWVSGDAHAATFEQVARSGDGGATWTAWDAFASIAQEDASMIVGNSARVFVARETVIAAELPSVYYTDDNGVTFNQVQIGGVVNHGIVALFWLNSTNLWAGDDFGYLYYSSDNGLTYTEQVATGGIFGAGIVRRISFYDQNVGYAVGSSAVDLFARTIDGGNTWEIGTVPTGGAGALMSVVAVNDNLVYVGDDDGNLWGSFDRGTTWAQVAIAGDGAGAGGAADGITDIRFLNEQFGYLTYTYGARGYTYRTTDGGALWDLIATDDNDAYHVVDMQDVNEAYIGGLYAAGATGLLEELFADKIV